MQLNFTRLLMIDYALKDFEIIVQMSYKIYVYLGGKVKLEKTVSWLNYVLVTDFFNFLRYELFLFMVGLFTKLVKTTNWTDRNRIRVVWLRKQKYQAAIGRRSSGTVGLQTAKGCGGGSILGRIVPLRPGPLSPAPEIRPIWSRQRINRFCCTSLMQVVLRNPFNKPCKIRIWV